MAHQVWVPHKNESARPILHNKAGGHSSGGNPTTSERERERARERERERKKEQGTSTYVRYMCTNTYKTQKDTHLQIDMCVYIEDPKDLD